MPRGARLTRRWGWLALAAVVLPAGRFGRAQTAVGPDERAVTLAMDRALKFLAETQQPDGSWLSPGFPRCTAIASLAVMAFLATGHTPQDGPFQSHVLKGIRFVLAEAQPDGYLGGRTGRMYGHGTSTLMLAEVVGMVPRELEPEVRKKLSAAVRLILDAQKIPKPPPHAGGWRYEPRSPDSDVSCTGWQLMALRAARNAGGDVPAEPINQAVAYLKRCACPGGGFGYQNNSGPNAARTGTGILGLEICGEHDTAEARAGAEWLLRNPPTWHAGFLFYEIYYCSQGMFQMGDKYWSFYKPRLEKLLVEHQAPDGSWLAPGGSEHNAGKAYCTAMAVLALSVGHHYLPIYQR